MSEELVDNKIEDDIEGKRSPSPPLKSLPVQEQLAVLLKYKDWPHIARVVYAHKLEHEFPPAMLIENMLSANEYKAASRFAAQFELTAQYPPIDMVNRAYQNRLFADALKLAHKHSFHITGMDVMPIWWELFNSGEHDQAIDLLGKMGLRERADVRRVIELLVLAHRLDLACKLARKDLQLQQLACELACQHGMERAMHPLVDFLGLQQHYPQYAAGKYECSVAPDHIHWVDTHSDWKNVEELLFAPHVTAIGFDTESKPSLLFAQQGGKNLLALMQIATSTDVFLVDLLSVSLLPIFGHLMSRLFGCERIAKLGVGVAEDLKAVRNAVLPTVVIPVCKNTIELLPIFVDTAPRIGTSLQTIALWCLQKRLDKSVRMSDWAARPLNERQLQYAAADATVALDIFAVLQNDLKRLKGVYDERDISIDYEFGGMSKRSKAKQAAASNEPSVAHMHSAAEPSAPRHDNSSPTSKAFSAAAGLSPLPSDADVLCSAKVKGRWAMRNQRRRENKINRLATEVARMQVNDEDHHET
eukprot:TRINITY_DN3300_c0_g2_i1.p1 TRINITY_DN3300_c0_g2~~TRINITY_DN3300_c0_g2_i1.p1  ORF type:complete len:530 (+),score=91.33 TRINITY_DN3300_c0_g2_i1:69-1658(+)